MITILSSVSPLWAAQITKFPATGSRSRNLGKYSRGFLLEKAYLSQKKFIASGFLFTRNVVLDVSHDLKKTLFYAHRMHISVTNLRNKRTHNFIHS